MWFFNHGASLPKGTGNYVPGIYDVMIDYGKNGIFMRFYYPTDEKITIESAKDKWLPEMPDYDYIVGMSNVLMMPTFLINLAWLSSGKIRIPAQYGAKLADNANMKVIIFSHGLGALRTFYSSMCVELASRGYLVAVLEHRDESACHTYYFQSLDDAMTNRKSKIEFKSVPLGNGHLEMRREQIAIRKEEVFKAIDFFFALNAGTIPHNIFDDVPDHGIVEFQLSQLVGKIDTKNISVAGHSFGAATCLLAMSERPEIKLGTLLDPWMFPIKGMQLERLIRQPLVFINTQTFHIDKNIQELSLFWCDNDPNRKMYTIKKSTHENQTDSVLIVGYWLNWFMRKIDPKLALRINNYLIVKHLSEFVDDSAAVGTDIEAFLAHNKGHFYQGLTKPWG